MHPAVSYWYTVVVLISAVIALSESLQVKPTCSLEYAFHHNPSVTTQLAVGILSQPRGGRVSVSMK
ncbi:hypothetical protein ANCCAN_29866 [Ancylostoma caninum]|uniref:Uncharacterized protein n=1 Tax=Ancylostoma caninum TaxID=29170 RepID=A0A368F2K7_ANCCA|nr:hypothetical protein ANCCAN_29866 [Ancylostoma caninum]